MKSLRATASLLCLGLGMLGPAGPASAQSPDVPPGPALLVGQIVHAERPEAAADLEVLLYALSDDGSAGLRPGRSDANGHFRFEGISSDASVVYLVGVRAGEIPFGKRFRFEPGAIEHSLVLELSDPVSDTAGVRAGDVTVLLARGCTHLRVEHNHQIANPGDRVIFVPESERGSATPILEVELPEDVEGFESLLGTAGLDREGRRLRFWGPLYPGNQELAFGYGQPMELGSLEIGFPQGAESFELQAARGDFSLEAPRLVADPSEGPVQRLRAEAIEAGERVALRVAATPRESSPLRAPRAEVWLELDDAALDVSERIEVVAPVALPSSSAPLLCLPLPRGARALRFSDETLAAGLRRDPSGDLALHGPLPEGATQVAVSYRIPASSAGARFEMSFDRDVALLSVLVADTGIVAETDRLHRRRPIRAEERMYLHWEAFAVEAGERVELGLRPTPVRGAGGGWASTGFAVLAGLAALGFLSGPLRDDRPEHREAIDPIERQRTALGRAFSDLEEDLETGKLDDDDYAALRSELEARGEALQHAAVAPASSAAQQTPSALPACAACQTPLREGDRFCSQCGAARPGGAQSA